MNYLKVMFDLFGNIKQEIPENFKKIEYLYAPTTQRILVNSTLNIGDIIETKAITDSTNNYRTIIGSPNNSKFELYYYNKEPKIFGSISILNKSKNSDDSYTIKAKLTSDQLSSFYLFDYNSGGYPLNGKIFYLKITRKNKIIYNFIPCLDSKDIPCMYDSINKKTYYNSGTGSFLAGPII